MSTYIYLLSFMCSEGFERAFTNSSIDIEDTLIDVAPGATELPEHMVLQGPLGSVYIAPHPAGQVMVHDECPGAVQVSAEANEVEARKIELASKIRICPSHGNALLARGVGYHLVLVRASPET